MYNILLTEGRVEDAREYLETFIDENGYLKTEEDVNEVLGYFVEGDPSGNNKYLMWMAKIYANDSGFSPNMLTDYVQRFHNNVDRLTPAIIADMGFYSGSNLVLSPRNIDSYPDYRTLKRVVDEVESIQTRKQTETKAKSSSDKIYEDSRWLVVKPHSLASSCYYGAGTKWCTTEKEGKHFADYYSKGPLYYIIDKTRQLGRFYKIALHKPWNGNMDEYYDEKDKLIQDDVLDAILALLPHRLQQNIFDDWEDTEPVVDSMSLREFRYALENYLERVYKSDKSYTTVTTESGKWNMHIDDNNVWTWVSQDNPNIVVQATPFIDNENELPFDSEDIENIDSPDPWGWTYGSNHLETPSFTQQEYLEKNPIGYRDKDSNLATFLRQIYLPLVKKVLSGNDVKSALGSSYKTWRPGSWVSTYAFKYPPKAGSLTQRFVDYIKKNPGKTSNEFYVEALGYPRPKGHNNSFFAAIKDAGIVEMNRRGRQFVYVLGPNYEDWKEGKLLKV